MQDRSETSAPMPQRSFPANDSEGLASVVGGAACKQLTQKKEETFPKEISLRSVPTTHPPHPFTTMTKPTATKKTSTAKHGKPSGEGKGTEPMDSVSVVVAILNGVDGQTALSLTNTLSSPLQPSSFRPVSKRSSTMPPSSPLKMKERKSPATNSHSS
jgi:hypothetical protein